MAVFRIAIWTYIFVRFDVTNWVHFYDNFEELYCTPKSTDPLECGFCFSVLIFDLIYYGLGEYISIIVILKNHSCFAEGRLNPRPGLAESEKSVSERDFRMTAKFTTMSDYKATSKRNTSVDELTSKNLTAGLLMGLTSKTAWQTMESEITTNTEKT